MGPDIGMKLHQEVMEIVSYDIMIMKFSSRSRSSQGQGHIKISHSRSRLLKVKATQG